jgi:hypothetical protein
MYNVDLRKKFVSFIVSFLLIFSLAVSTLPQTVLAARPLPNAPSNLVATTISSSRIDLTWQDNSSGETGFRIERKTASGSYSQIATVRAGVTSYSNNGLAASTTYYYRVRAYNAAGNSNYSNEASATTLPPPPSAPTLKAPANGSTVPTLTPRLEWNASSGAVSYGVQVSTSSSFKSLLVNETGITNVHYDIASGILHWNTTYYWRVNARNSFGTSSWSSYRYFKTSRTPPRFTLTISSTAGGNVSTPGVGTFTRHAGTVVDLVATPDAGYRFVNWAGDADTIANVNAAATNITMSGNYSITANFVALYDLTISSTAGGNVTTPGEGTFTYDDGTVVNLVATTDAGYRFVNWTGNVGTIGNVTAPATNITTSGDYAITANFVALYDLTIASTAGGNVTTPGEGTFTYDDGTVVNLVATPASGYRFVNWTGNVGTIANVTAAATNITMSGDYAITANFVALYDLTISSTAGGNVTTPGEGTFTYDAGTVVDLVATPDEGYRFDDWTGNVGTIANVNAAATNITMNGDYSITANFVALYDLTIASTAGGNVTTPGEGTFTYDDGTVVNLVAVPASGYRFVNWTGNVGTIANVNAAATNITMSGNYSITANFVAVYDLTISSTAGGNVTTPGEGAFTYDDGTVVNLVATPASGYRFVNWTGNVGTIGNVTAAATNITTNGDYEITANFEVTPMVATGGFHTVGLKSDGTVLTVGDNGYEQLNVGGWTNITQVAAGYFNTVGLKSDGTVLAVGRNDYGQCNVSSWTGIVQVAAGYFNTVGLKSDGTVLAVGENGSGQCNVGGWTNITQVAACYVHAVGLKADGTVVAVGDNGAGECNVGGWTDIVQVAAGFYYTLGLKSDGTVVAVGWCYYGECNVGGWTDIVQVSAPCYSTVGLKSDGTVVAVGRNYYGECNVSSWTGIVQVAAGYYHTVGLKSDGTVVAVGRNDWGQCNVGGWMLK